MLVPGPDGNSLTILHFAKRPTALHVDCSDQYSAPYDVEVHVTVNNFLRTYSMSKHSETSKQKQHGRSTTPVIPRDTQSLLDTGDTKARVLD